MDNQKVTINGVGEVLPWEEEEAKRIVICYYDGCGKKVYPNSYWCTKTHQILWQKAHYGEDGEKRGPKSVEQIQQQIQRLKANVTQNKLI